MKLKCEHPNIIFNPNLKWLFCCKGFRHLVYPDHCINFDNGKYFYNFPWCDFYHAKEMVNLDNIDSFVISNDDGEAYPVFMAVPCGKCRLCRDKKCDDWETRCVCESASSDFPPLFITLTYRPEDRPDSADDCKRDFQLFMKRLRQFVSRTLGKKDCELRYFARSERTPKNHYWHIHFLLWNMPFVSSCEGAKNSFAALIYAIQNICWQHGITRVERARDRSGAYCMKYARKDDCNPEYWQLASRRNGIGNKFAMSLLPTVLKNPDMMSFYVPGEKRPRAIPSYFKRIWFPTLSVLFPADVCKASKDFMECATQLHYFMSHTYPTGCRADDIVEMVSDVAEKYRIMHIDFDDARPNRKFCRESDSYMRTRDSVGQLIPLDDRRISRVPVPVVCDGFLVPELRDCVLSVGTDRRDLIPTRRSKASLLTPAAFDFRYRLITQWTLLKRSYEILMNYEFDEDNFLYRLSVTAAHQDYVRTMVDKFPECDVDELVVLHERDRAWIDTHWMQSEIG